jgi:Lrp/AsnC family transcriptional regulator, leucine-responsive regulatory protein
MVEDQDRRILAQLQKEGRATNQELAEAVGMSTSACWRRVRALEESGIIRGYAASRRPPSFTCRWNGTTRNSSTSSSQG